MLYSIHLYALSADELSKQMRENSVGLLNQLSQKIDRLVAEKGAVPQILAAAESLIQNPRKKAKSQHAFDAFVCLLHFAGEHIKVPSLQSINNSSFIDEIGVWPLTQIERSPVPVPCNELLPSAFGFMSCQLIQTRLPNLIASLPHCPSRQAHRARTEFVEVAESVASDGLDLFAHFAVW